MKPLDLSKFKKISSSKSHSVFTHPDGHFIKVSHKTLPQGELEKLTKLKNGGIVGEDSSYWKPDPTKPAETKTKMSEEEMRKVV